MSNFHTLPNGEPMQALATAPVGNPDAPQILTPDEVGAILRKPLRRIYELVKLRKLVAIRDGRRFTFLLSDVEECVRRMRTTEEALPTKRSLAMPGTRVSPGRQRSGGVP